MATRSPAWLRFAPALFLLLWSGGFSFAKMGIAYTGPLTFLALRYTLVMVVLVPLFVIMRPPLPRRPAEWGHLVVVGTLIQALYFICSYLAFEQKVAAGVVALIVSLQPILVALLAPRFAHESVSARRWLGLGLGLLGAAVVIVARSDVHGGMPVLGMLSAGAALLFITGGTLYEKRFGVSQHPITSNLVLYGVGFAITLPLAIGLEGFQVHWSIPLAVALGYLVIGNSLVAITLLLAMIRAGEASRVSALFFLVPPTAALIAWGLLGETLPTFAWAGMALAAIGVLIASRAPPATATD